MGGFICDKYDPKDAKSAGIVLLRLCSQIEILEPSLPPLIKNIKIKQKNQTVYILNI